MSLFDTIRDTCGAVAERAEAVRIERDRVPSYAASLPLGQVGSPSLDPAHHFFGTPEDTLAYVLAIDAINFGSGYFPYVRKQPGLSGYLTVATSLKEWFEREGGAAPETLTRLTADDCARMLGQAEEAMPGPRRELMGLFAEALNTLGRYVAERFDGRFAALVEAAGHSAEMLVSLLDRMPFYHDVHAYGDLMVPFYKRAQITAADLSIALPDHPWGRFDDLDQLTIFADNLVPHVLRMDGVLRFEDSLLERVNREEPIPAGSPEEVEIRACGLTAVEMVVAELRQRGQHATARDLDYFLWNRGQRPEYKSQPRHRARCVFY